MKISKNKKAIVILVIAIAVVIIILSIVLAVLNRKTEEEKIAELEEKNRQVIENIEIEKLSNMTEMQRMKTYLADFIENIEKKKYDKAYEVLYSDFKENYFRTLTEFENYCKEYFPLMFNLKNNNIERLNNIYVLENTITDLTSTNKEFRIYFVIRENELNDYDLSFSVNSAKDA